MQGTAAEELALFEKLKARGGFAGEDRAELLKVDRVLRTFTANAPRRLHSHSTDRCGRS
jgi:hypothetical protein